MGGGGGMDMASMMAQMGGMQGAYNLAHPTPRPSLGPKLF